MRVSIEITEILKPRTSLKTDFLIQTFVPLQMFYIVWKVILVLVRTDNTTIRNTNIWVQICKTCLCFGATSILTNTNIAFQVFKKIGSGTKIFIIKTVLYL